MEKIWKICVGVYGIFSVFVTYKTKWIYHPYVLAAICIVFVSIVLLTTWLWILQRELYKMREEIKRHRVKIDEQLNQIKENAVNCERNHKVSQIRQSPKKSTG
jgi:hypothetical protein